jgi:hypothetical protein
MQLTLTKAAISTELLSQLSFTEQYAAAAYCPENNTPGSSSVITCGAGNCPLIEADKVTTLAEFQQFAS